MKLVILLCVNVVFGVVNGVHEAGHAGNFMANTPCISFQGQNILWSGPGGGLSGLINSPSGTPWFNHPFFGLGAKQALPTAVGPIEASLCSDSDGAAHPPGSTACATNPATVTAPATPAAPIPVVSATEVPTPAATTPVPTVTEAPPAETPSPAPIAPEASATVAPETPTPAATETPAPTVPEILTPAPTEPTPVVVEPTTPPKPVETVNPTVPEPPLKVGDEGSASAEKTDDKKDKKGSATCPATSSCIITPPCAVSHPVIPTPCPTVNPSNNTPSCSDDIWKQLNASGFVEPWHQGLYDAVDISSLPCLIESSHNKPYSGIPHHDCGHHIPHFPSYPCGCQSGLAHILSPLNLTNCNFTIPDLPVIHHTASCPIAHNYHLPSPCPITHNCHVNIPSFKPIVSKAYLPHSIPVQPIPYTPCSSHISHAPISTLSLPRPLPHPIPHPIPRPIPHACIRPIVRPHVNIETYVPTCAKPIYHRYEEPHQFNHLSCNELPCSHGDSHYPLDEHVGHRHINHISGDVSAPVSDLSHAPFPSDLHYDEQAPIQDRYERAFPHNFSPDYEQLPAGDFDEASASRDNEEQPPYPDDEQNIREDEGDFNADGGEYMGCPEDYPCEDDHKESDRRENSEELSAPLSNDVPFPNHEQ